MNNRIKKLRKYLSLTQQEFANRIGVKRNTVANYETGRNSPIDSVVSLICREFNVNETWLREGTGEMFAPAPSFSLDQFVTAHGATDLELEILKAYFELSPEVRSSILSHFSSRLSHILPPVEDSVEKLEEAYKKSVSNSAQNTAACALNTINGTEKTASNG